jgi:hypothetical protein
MPVSVWTELHLIRIELVLGPLTRTMTKEISKFVVKKFYFTPV